MMAVWCFSSKTEESQKYKNRPHKVDDFGSKDAKGANNAKALLV